MTKTKRKEIIEIEGVEHLDPPPLEAVPSDKGRHIPNGAEGAAATRAKPAPKAKHQDSTADLLRRASIILDEIQPYVRQGLAIKGEARRLKDDIDGYLLAD